MVIHAPLPSPTSIRLLRRLRTADDGLLCFSLETVDLEKRPFYHCLSYTWGNPLASATIFKESFEAAEPEYKLEDSHPIRCNGKVVKIGRNLWDALNEIPTDGWLRSIINRPNPRDKRVMLHDKAVEGNANLIRLWIGEGANVHARDSLGKHPLHYAASNGHFDAVKVFIKAGSNYRAKDDNGRTAQDCAIENNHEEVAVLLENCAKDGGKAISDEVADFTTYGTDDFIWIDAICVDQQNLKERAAQVSVMNLVYSEARYVMSWLGRQDNYTSAALKTMANLIACGERFANSDIVPFRFDTPAHYEKFNIPYISPSEWDALASLLLRQYFRRCWVAQEVVFAQSMVFYCGNMEIKWSDISYVVRLLMHRYRVLGHESSTIYAPLTDAGLSIEYYFHVLEGFRERRFELAETGNKQIQTQFSLLRLVIATFPFSATDPRDKIFSLLALTTLHPPVQYPMTPNYFKAVEQCYSEVTKGIAASSEDLEILTFVQDGSLKIISELPSWVPDYSLKATNPVPSTHFKPHGSLSFKLTESQFLLNWDQLSIFGMKIDVIDHVTSERPLGGANKKLNLDPSWFDVILALDTSRNYRRTEQSLSEGLWRTLCADQDDAFNHPAPANFGPMFITMICAMACAEPEWRLREEKQQKENAVRLGGLLASALNLQNEPSGDSRGPDEDSMASIRQKLNTDEDRSSKSPFLDCIRPTLAKLDALAATAAGKFFPNSNDVETYFQKAAAPIVNPNETFFIPPEIAPFVHAHMRRYGRRRLFATSKGYLGLGPASLERGDVVYILPGARVPFVLRSVAYIKEGGCEGEEEAKRRPCHYRLVGEAYVHGIMHGEAIDEQIEAEQQLEEIVLI